jgi:glycosyltransferase involved in cell wall biosynthesis
MNDHLIILILYHELTPRQRLILRTLKGWGWKISVIAWDREGGAAIPDEDGDLYDSWSWIKVTAPQASVELLWKMPKYYYRAWKILLGLNKSDLVMLTHFVMLPLGVFSRNQTIYNCAEMFALGISKYFGLFRSIVRPIISLVEGVFVSQVDGVISVDSKGKWLERFYRRWNPHVLALWNVTSQADDPDAEEIAALERQYSGVKVVAYVGILRERKGLHVAIEAAALVREKHPDSLFLFIGPMNGDQDKVEELMEERGVAESILFLPQMPYRNMLAHLHHAKIGLALYQYDHTYDELSVGNARKLFTYMQAGIAIIGPDFGEIGKSVEIAKCGVLINTGSVEEVADTIIRLLSDSRETERMARNGRKAFLERFNWEIEQRNFYSFMNTIVT